jgi:hypothetical protein
LRRFNPQRARMIGIEGCIRRYGIRTAMVGLP